MPQNKPNTSQKFSKYFQKNSNKALILAIFIVSLCFIIYGFWIYIIIFLIPKEPLASEIMQKRLKIDTQQYQETIQYLTNDLEAQTPKIDKNPFE